MLGCTHRYAAGASCCTGTLSQVLSSDVDGDSPFEPKAKRDSKRKFQGENRFTYCGVGPCPLALPLSCPHFSSRVTKWVTIKVRGETPTFGTIFPWIHHVACCTWAPGWRRPPPDCDLCAHGCVYWSGTSILQIQGPNPSPMGSTGGTACPAAALVLSDPGWESLIQDRIETSPTPYWI